MTTAPRFSRRILLGGAAASAGLVALGAGGQAAASQHLVPPEPGDGWGKDAIVPFYGPHQAGVVATPASHARFLAFDLLPDIQPEGIRRMLRILTEDAARMAEGQPPLADSEPELAVVPAHLSVTIGFGPGLVSRVGGQSPDWLGPLPPFSIDRLQPELGGGDLLLIVQADDLVTVSHASRVLTRQTRSFLQPRWNIDGFRRAVGSEPAGTTMRNLFGQVDGTASPDPQTDGFRRAVWGAGASHSGPAWLAGGTGYVLRRIVMDLDTWDEVDRRDRELSVGRHLDTGAPLGGERESDAPDLTARDALGLPVIPDFAHVRRARAQNPHEVIARRGYNYELDHGVQGEPESGLLFEAFAHDPQAQFVPIQRRLAEMDMMNLWTTPVGSSVFAIPPGCEPGGYIGDTLV